MSYVAQDINLAGLVYRNARDSQLVVWGTQNLSKMGEFWFNYRWLQGNLQDPSGDEFHGKPCPLPHGHSQPVMVSSGEFPELQFQGTETLHLLGLLLLQGDRLMGEGGGMGITPSSFQMPPCTLTDLWSWCFMMEVLIYSLLPGNPSSSFQIYVITQPQ